MRCTLKKETDVDLLSQIKKKKTNILYIAYIDT